MRAIFGHLLRHTALAAAVVLSVAAGGAVAAPTHGGPSLVRFPSEAALQDFLKRLKRAAPRAMLDAAPPPPADAVQTVVVTAASAASITNNQVSSVDEGDIVKQHGDSLVILRRGRLFTVSIADHGLRPVDAINAYPPGVNAQNDWYDEMLVSGDQVIVIGYSYGRGGTEINRFHIDRAGHLAFEDAYQLRSDDYYSARNYASRLIGHQLILYSPRYLPYDNAQLALPALRRWTGSASASFERIGTAREVYLSPGLQDSQIQAVHTVTSCDLTAAILACKATSVFGPNGRVFYVSAQAVYVWVTAYGDAAGSLLYRLPLDGGAPSAIRVRGAPVDQFSFREDAADNVLNVLVRSEGAGDAMWRSDFAQGAVALLRLPLDAFGDGSAQAARAFYRPLPTPRDDEAFHNRFVGDYVLYGEGNDWGTPQSGDAELVAAPLAGGAPTRLVLPHGVDRIEAMGRDAVVVGSDDKNVYFSAVDLVPGAQPSLGDRYTLTGAAQAETRSHGFFFHPDGSDDDGGVLGLPVARPARPAYRQLFETSAAMIFLRRSGGQFRGLGELDAQTDGIADDACVASCDDWYGNARPIFIGQRSFALLGYELVEGRVSRSAIRETGRVNFAPARRVR